MWAATVWHEYTHVLTLALSKHRVPRWLTEGFSVYEERQRNPAWERGMDRELFDAYHNGDIVPVLQLNRLFRGPRILFGYYQGGLIVEYLSEKYGFDRVVALKMFTVSNSESMLAEDYIGSLEPGKFADFAVLLNNWLEGPDSELGYNKVIMTVVGDEVVYEDPGAPWNNEATTAAR